MELAWVSRTTHGAAIRPRLFSSSRAKARGACMPKALLPQALLMKGVRMNGLVTVLNQFSPQLRAEHSSKCLLGRLGKQILS